MVFVQRVNLSVKAIKVQVVETGMWGIVWSFRFSLLL